jgi:multidrug efflux system outer membrane protein
MIIKQKITYLYIKLVVICMIITVAGCKTTEPSALPALTKMPGTFTDSLQAPSTVLSWKDVFIDNNLKTLIDSALINNYDLKSGLQRILIAEANMKLSKASLLPSLSAELNGGVDKFGRYTMNGVGNYDTNLSPNINGDQRIPDPTGDYFMGFRSSWEIDIWGKLSKRKQAAYNRYLASTKGQQWYRTQLVAQVANMYFELVALDRQMKILNSNIKLQQKGVEIIEAQLAGGRATSLAVSQFRAQMLSTEGKQFEIKQAIKRIENELNSLLGRYPEKINRDTAAINQVLPSMVYAGIPSEVLLRRPDIQEAELKLKAAKADVQAARKAMLPSLTLNAYSGFNSFKLPLLLSPGSLASGVLGGLTGPIFNRGTLKNGKVVATAAQLNAFYNYQQHIIQGYQEVSTQLGAIHNYKEAYQLKTKEVTELKQALSTANDLYLAGYANYLEVIVAQGSVLNAEMEQVSLKRQSYAALVQLFRALGI